MTQRPRKGDYRDLKSYKMFGEACPWNPLEACTSGTHLGNRSVFILDPHLVTVTLIFHTMSKVRVMAD